MGGIMMASTRARACIFDLDGTLVDSEPVYFTCDRDFLFAHDIAFTEDMSHAVMGRGSVDVMRFLKERFPDSPFTRLPVDRMMVLRDTWYLERGLPLVRAFPAMRSLVEALDAEDMPMAVASGSSPSIVEACLGATGLGPFFRTAVSSAEVEHGKPAPDVFLEAARRLGVNPGDCLVLEDAVAGVMAAKAAGMRCVALPAPGSSAGTYVSADLVIEGGPAAADTAALLTFALGVQAFLPVGPAGYGSCFFPGTAVARPATNSCRLRSPRGGSQGGSP